MGFSAGRDSTVLLDALARTFGASRIVAVHVHHGLHADADAWAAVARSTAQSVGVEFVERRVVVDAVKLGIEAAARAARYDALIDGCLHAGAAVLALAHHRDDQAETVLMQLVRGAGLQGLAAMPVWRTLRGVEVWRPLLDVGRAEIDLVAKARSLRYTDDPSNSDVRFTRNRFRAQVLPTIEHAHPSAVTGIARSARHLQDALALVGEIARSDLDGCRIRDGLSIERLSALSSVRRDAALRQWLTEFDPNALPESRFDELVRQIESARTDSQLAVRFADGHVSLSRGVLAYVLDREVDAAASHQDATLNWQGEADWVVPNWSGCFRFTPGEGISEAMLRSEPLIARERRGGERFRDGPGRLSRSLKLCYQYRDVPLWLRQNAPLLFVGERLIWAPGLGLNLEWADPDSPGMRIDWQAHSTRSRAPL